MVSKAKTDVEISIDAAAKVAEEQPKQKDTITLSNGIILLCKQVPMLTVRYALTAIPKPEPPVIHNEEKGRSEVWEGDPAYQAALSRWEEQVGDTTFNVMLMLGTQIEHMPEGIDHPEHESWLETLEATGMSVNVDTKAARYLSWLRFYAISSNEDYGRISEAVARKSGLLERDVQASLQSFRGGENGRADLATTPEEHSEHGDNLPSTNGGANLGS